MVAQFVADRRDYSGLQPERLQKKARPLWIVPNHNYQRRSNSSYVNLVKLMIRNEADAEVS